MSYEVHREPLYRRYYTPVFSGATLYAVVLGFVLLFVPLMIAYNSSNFWLKEAVSYEQPQITYRYDSIVQMYGMRESTPFSLYFSTNPQLNTLNSQHLRAALLETAEFDDNLDGTYDRIELSVAMPIAANEVITGFAALSYLDVKLLQPAKYVFDALAFFQHDASTGCSKLSVDGDVLLRQTWPFATKGGYRVPYPDSEELIAPVAGSSAKDFSVSEIMQRGNARNFSTVFRPNYVYCSHRATAQAGTVGAANNVDTVQFANISMIMRVPAQPLRYFPGVSEVLKVAWIQYAAFFVLVAFVLFRLNSFVFRHQLLNTYVSNDVVHEKME